MPASASIPMKPGYYWAKLRIPAEGTHEAELWDTSVMGWEIVQVNENSADWADNPAEDEALSVAVPGIRETQWREGFVWGEFVAPLEKSEKLFFDIFSGGRWIGMAEGVDQDAAKRMAARSLPQLAGHFTLIRWYGRLHPDNCIASGGKRPNPKAEAA